MERERGSFEPARGSTVPQNEAPGVTVGVGVVSPIDPLSAPAVDGVIRRSTDGRTSPTSAPSPPTSSGADSQTHPAGRRSDYSLPLLVSIVSGLSVGEKSCVDYYYHLKPHSVTSFKEPTITISA